MIILTQQKKYIGLNHNFTPSINILGIKKINNTHDADIESIHHSDTFYKEIVEDDYHSKWKSFPQIIHNSCGKSIN